MTLPLGVAAPPQPPSVPDDEFYTSQLRRLTTMHIHKTFLGRGYDRDGVDLVVGRVGMLIKQLAEDHRRLRVDYDAVWAENNARKKGLLPDESMSGPLAKLLVDAQRTAMDQGEEQVAAAISQSGVIVDAARGQAQAIVAAAHAEAERIVGNAHVQVSQDAAAQPRALAGAMLDHLNAEIERQKVARDVFAAELSLCDDT